MPQPPAYNRQADFTGWSTDNPGLPQRGVSLDAEFNAIVATLAVTLANLALIQRDDGRLRNGSVGPETLSAGLLALINSARGMRARLWATATAYEAGLDWVGKDTGTYFCAVSHLSDDFDADFAAGKWVLIFDSAGAIPADGSVTTPKLADGAVTAAKVGFAALDLAGTLRGQAGLLAGTAAPGDLIAGKAASGDAVSSIERTARAQGRVGFRLGGGAGGLDWTIAQPAGSDIVEVREGMTLRVSFMGAATDFAGHVRATGDGTPASGGPGIGLRYLNGIGYLDCFDFTASAWRPGQMRALTWAMTCGNITVLSAGAQGVNFPVEATIGAAPYSIGYRDVPQNAQNGAYTLALADRGKHIYSANSAAQTITIPNNDAVAFPLGAAVTIVNRGSNPITLAAAAGVTLRLAGPGSTGSRTLAVNGLATLLKVQTNAWMVTGAGVS